MAISIGTGQEMKISIKSAGIDGNKQKTIRYVNPLAANTSEVNLTALARALQQNSTDPYVSTSGNVDIGILSEV